MKNFIIFNSEKEGSCALVQMLNSFCEVSIISEFIEPFDRHMFVKNEYGAGKDISKEDFLRCLSLIFDSSSNYLEELNTIYARYNKHYTFSFSKEKSRGFKMRVREQWNDDLFEFLKEYKVTSFVLIRQDLLRWALSKYHGDGTGKRGHLQFSNVHIEDLPKLKVHWGSLKKEIKKCEGRITNKKKLLKDLRNSGVEAFPLYYEDFCYKKPSYFKNLLRTLDIVISDEEIQQVLMQDCNYNKVHPDDISAFVDNHQEITKKFDSYMERKKTFPRNFFSRIPKVVGW
jgi:hypothetical protein